MQRRGMGRREIAAAMGVIVTRVDTLLAAARDKVRIAQAEGGKP